MRRISVINQKGGVGKTTTCANLGAAFALSGRRTVLVDMDAQANLTLSLNVESPPGSPSTYTLLSGESTFEASLRPTTTAGLRLLPANIDLSGAELELAAAMGREHLMREALVEWEQAARAKDGGRAPAEYVIFDCPPSLGLLSINALAASDEVLIAIQTEFLAMQGMSKLFEILQLLKKRLNPRLEIAGILPCLYDSRLKLAREVLAEIRKYFPGKVLPCPVRSNVKLAEAPSFGQTIFEYAPDSNGALDYVAVAKEIGSREALDPDFAKMGPIGVPAPAVKVEEKLAKVVLTPPPPPVPATKAPAAVTPKPTTAVAVTAKPTTPATVDPKPKKKAVATPAPAPKVQSREATQPPPKVQAPATTLPARKIEPPVSAMPATKIKAPATPKPAAKKIETSATATVAAQVRAPAPKAEALPPTSSAPTQEVPPPAPKRRKAKPPAIAPNPATAKSPAATTPGDSFQVLESYVHPA